MIPMFTAGGLAYFKTEQMQGKVSFFLSGKMISVGTKNEVHTQKELDLAKRVSCGEGFC